MGKVPTSDLRIQKVPFLLCDSTFTFTARCLRLNEVFKNIIQSNICKRHRSFAFSVQTYNRNKTKFLIEIYKVIEPLN